MAALAALIIETYVPHFHSSALKVSRLIEADAGFGSFSLSVDNQNDRSCCHFTHTCILNEFILIGAKVPRPCVLTFGDDDEVRRYPMMMLLQVVLRRGRRRAARVVPARVPPLRQGATSAQSLEMSPVWGRTMPQPSFITISLLRCTPVPMVIQYLTGCIYYFVHLCPLCVYNGLMYMHLSCVCMCLCKVGEIVPRSWRRQTSPRARSKSLAMVPTGLHECCTAGSDTRH